ncbi:MAG TPA: DUF5606 domain-containing protein [Chitinophagaceae bacterium]|nr:DUF5606 domain-containing protein [Chitinophagaceae bacterium]
MEYAKIIAITGMPGLYEMVNSKGDGAIVKSLDDHTTKFVSGRVHQFTHLESIEVYTERENVNLVEVLNAMKDSTEKLPDEKDNKALQAYFQKVYPSLDFERVYASDMKKMVKWFSVLKNNDVEIKLSEPEDEEEAPVEEPAEEVEAPVEEPTQKPAKKSAPGKEEKPAAPAREEKPKAKAEEKPKKAAAKEEKKPKAKAEAKPARKTAKKEAPAKKAAAKKKKEK